MDTNWKVKISRGPAVKRKMNRVHFKGHCEKNNQYLHPLGFPSQQSLKEEGTVNLV